MNVPGVALGNHLGVFHAQKHSLWLVVAGRSYETVQGTLFTKNHEPFKQGSKEEELSTTKETMQSICLDMD